MQNNEAAMAANGTGPFERIGTFPDLRAAASLFPKPVHVLVMAASNIASVNDLYGKRIAVAATGPAAATEAADILRAHRVTPATLPSAPQEMSLGDSLAGGGTRRVRRGSDHRRQRPRPRCRTSPPLTRCGSCRSTATRSR